MLLFYAATADELSAIRRDGLREVRLWPALDAARRAEADCALVIKAAALEGVPAEAPSSEPIRVPRVPPEAICNLDPYRAPVPVAAGGGYVVRFGTDGPEVLLIFRRGAWDLPKGKQDPGESIEACALREVREEIGVEVLEAIRPLGTTVHGYTEGEVYRVKTTHWFLMRTPERTFIPQAKEGIERVAWTPWEEARRRLGYSTLRRHLERVSPVVRRAQAAFDKSL